ncbi:PREDICTED: uncharacterized protein LOC109592155 [Amphimedon queenslandica]|uniref:Uncharacterized protein n=1 Tax=Amphimedon queenslandica TaxID=400682 RepID=A0AAN0K1M5_AMPQE|nr:PREDICTED: uncharacterized protein LOC109592155 [Amphimedon queenslandica]|eukprot:XP_019863250.1 PREDICTED: uncharacterized protein LOC109592155 [Amphimedon queenslandica]
MHNDATSNAFFIHRYNESKKFCYIKGIGRITTRHYSRSKRKSDFAITFIDDDEMKFGLIDEFRDENSFTVVVHEHYSLLLPNIIQFHLIDYHNQIRLNISRHQVYEKCIYFDIDSGLFFVNYPKNFVSD